MMVNIEKTPAFTIKTPVTTVTSVTACNNNLNLNMSSNLNMFYLKLKPVPRSLRTLHRKGRTFSMSIMHHQLPYRRIRKKIITSQELNLQLSSITNLDNSIISRNTNSIKKNRSITTRDRRNLDNPSLLT